MQPFFWPALPACPQPSLPSALAPETWAPELASRHQPPAPWAQDPAPPVIWSIAGNDSGGGAGLSSDARAAQVMGVHLCPVVAALTAQNSVGLQGVFPVPVAQLQAQLQSLAEDLRPRALKTGLLASVEAVQSVARVLDQLRAPAEAGGQPRAVALVVDPVLGASSGGTSFCSEALLRAYREWLIPRATLITPNRREAERLLGVAPGELRVPELAARLQALGAESVCITGGDDLSLDGLPQAAAHEAATEAHVEASAEAVTEPPPGSLPGTPMPLALDWFQGPIWPRMGGEPLAVSLHAAKAPIDGWLALPRLAPREGAPLHHHGTGCCFATVAAASLARGFPLPDAVLMAKMATYSGVRDGHAAGQGSGPVRPSAHFLQDPSCLPVMSFGDELAQDAGVHLQRWRAVLAQGLADMGAEAPGPGLSAQASGQGQGQGHAYRPGYYGLSSQSEVLARHAGQSLCSQLQLRLKRTPGMTDGDLLAAIQACVAAVQTPGSRTQLWINDHWQLALQAGAKALHLGQEDWQGLDAADRLRLLDPALAIGISSHTPWELARARGLAPRYIACGPVWPTTTKDMPWHPQGLNHLRWWVRMAGRPVVAIGGILSAGQAQEAWATGVASVCLVRALDAGGPVLDEMAAVQPHFED